MIDRITIKGDTIGQLAKSTQVQNELVRRARLVAQGAGAEVSQVDPRGRLIASGYIGRRRARASVMWPGGLVHEMAHRILGRAIDHARG